MKKVTLKEKQLEKIIMKALNEGQLLTELKISCCKKGHDDYDRGCCGRMRGLCCSHPNSGCCANVRPGGDDRMLDNMEMMNENHILQHKDPFKAGMLAEKANRANKFKKGQIAESYGLLLEAEPECCGDKNYDSVCCEDIMNACCNERISCCEDGWGDDNVISPPRGPRGGGVDIRYRD